MSLIFLLEIRQETICKLHIISVLEVRKLGLRKAKQTLVVVVMEESWDLNVGLSDYKTHAVSHVGCCQ